MSAPGGALGDATSQTSEAEVEELIPGIPNEVTVGQIATKLPRKDIDNLASVSRAWYDAITSRTVYEARVRSNSLDWLSFINTIDDGKRLAFTVYGDAGKPGLRLPPLIREVTAPRTVEIDGLQHYIPRNDKTRHDVALDGKLYVLWGLDGKVNVLDVAGQRQWKRCADMLKPRQEFGCGAIAGKLYRHGGAVDRASSSGTDVYNPEENTWTKIRPIVSLGCSWNCGRKRKEVFWRVGPDGERDPSPVTNNDPLEVYDPITDEWRVVEPVGTHKERMFVAGGKFYSMSPLGIQIYDFHAKSWGDLHPFSFVGIARDIVGIAPVDPVEISPIAILVDDGELLAIVDWRSARHHGSCLVLSKGLSSQNNEIVWNKPNYSETDFPRHVTGYGFFLSVKI